MPYTSDTFQRIIDSIPVAIFTVDGQKFDYLNPAALQLFGASTLQEMVGKPCINYVATAYHELHLKALRHLPEPTAVNIVNQQTYLRVDGSSIEVEVSTVPILIDGRKISLISVRDISAIKYLERQQKQRQHLLQAIIDHTPVLIFVKDLQGKYLTINKRFSETIHVDIDWMIGKTDHAIFPEEIATPMQVADQEVIRTGQPIEIIEYALIDNNINTYESIKFPLFDIEGKIWAVCGIAHDITEKEKADKIRLDLERKFISIYNQAAVGIMFFSPSGQVQLANPMICSMLGYSEEELKQLNFHDITYVDDRNDNELDAQQMLSGNVESVSRAKRYLRKDQSPIWADRTTTLIRDLEGNPQYFVSVIIDAEAIRTAEQELMEARKLALLGKLVAGVAHELNTPIGNGLLAITSLAEEQKIFEHKFNTHLKRSDLLNFSHQVANATEIVERNLSRSGELITRFKEVASDQSCDLRRVFSLNELIEQILSVWRTGVLLNAPIISSRIITDIQIDSYPGTLVQCLNNLINNAVTHAFPNGQIGSLEITASLLNQDNVIISVNDNGVGIPAEHLMHLFEPFSVSRLGAKGFGLGLHITQNLVKNILRGELSVSSKIGVGTQFSMRIPLIC